MVVLRVHSDSAPLFTGHHDCSVHPCEAGALSAYPHNLDMLMMECTRRQQIYDKEKVVAAMENPGLGEVVEECIKEVDY